MHFDAIFNRQKTRTVTRSLETRILRFNREKKLTKQCKNYPPKITVRPKRERAIGLFVLLQDYRKQLQQHDQYFSELECSLSSYKSSFSSSSSFILNQAARPIKNKGQRTDMNTQNMQYIYTIKTVKIARMSHFCRIVVRQLTGFSDSQLVAEGLSIPDHTQDPTPVSVFRHSLHLAPKPVEMLRYWCVCCLIIDEDQTA